MAYIYGILQAITNIGVNFAKPNKREIIIKNQSKKDYTYLCISTKININIIKTILRSIKTYQKEIKTLVKCKVKT